MVKRWSRYKRRKRVKITVRDYNLQKLQDHVGRTSNQNRRVVIIDRYSRPSEKSLRIQLSRIWSLRSAWIYFVWEQKKKEKNEAESITRSPRLSQHLYLCLVYGYIWRIRINVRFHSCTCPSCFTTRHSLFLSRHFSQTLFLHFLCTPNATNRPDRVLETVINLLNFFFPLFNFHIVTFLSWYFRWGFLMVIEEGDDERFSWFSLDVRGEAGSRISPSVDTPASTSEYKIIIIIRRRDKKQRCFVSRQRAAALFPQRNSRRGSRNCFTYGNGNRRQMSHVIFR